MIATGGLLRISRRQDSLRSKTRAESKRRRRAKKGRKSDVVVVKGKLQVCSLSGLVAAVGVVVLLVGIAMAVLGYWPRNKPQYSEAWAANNLWATRGGQPRGSAPLMAWNHTNSTRLGQQKELSLMQGNGTTLELLSPPPPAPAPLGIVGELLASCLHSDQLKMFGPLVMGMGIFLFICANAVLHEDRDRQTKVIDLRDIYSTVIDAHSLRSKDQSPLNGLVNYVQAHSGPEAGPGDGAGQSHSSWPSTLWGFGSGGGGGGRGSRRPSCSRRCSWWRDGGGWSDTVYSVHPEHERGAVGARLGGAWETGSIVTSSLNAFTLPVIKLNNREMEEGAGGEEEQVEQVEVGREAQCGEEEWSVGSKDRPSFFVAIETKAEISRADVSDSQSSLGAKRWGQGLSPRWSLSECGVAPQLPPAGAATGRKVAGSHLSLNSLPVAGVRGATGGRHDDRSRRFSCPRLDRSSSKGYIKLADLGGESFEGPDGGTLAPGEGSAGRSVVAAALSSSAAAVVVLVEAAEVSQGEQQAATSEHTPVEHTLVEHTLVEHTQPAVAHPHAVVTYSPRRFSSAGGLTNAP